MNIHSIVLTRLLIGLRMAWVGLFLWRPLINQTYCPQYIQDKLLKQILDKNRNTDIGKKFGFSKLKNSADFQKTVPVRHYEDLRGLIERQEDDQKPCITAEQPVMYAQTSGTTGRPKYIPILPETIKQYRRSQHCVAYAIHSAMPKTYSGKVLAIVSPTVEGYLPSGAPYGSMSGLIYRSMPDFVSANYVIPASVFEVADYELKYRLITVFAVAEENITLIATANPSTLLKIAEILKTHWTALVHEIGTGNLYGLHANPQRAEALKNLHARKCVIIFADIWPNLQTVTTWTYGSCAVLIPSLQKQLNQTTRIVEMGYLSSEFRGSITVDVDRNKGIPTIHENFFEFVERDQWDNKIEEFQTISSLVKGKQYYVIVTTQNGLYRYFINDIIEVDGWYNGTPTIHFVQKGKGVVNLTGEKLYESQVIEAVNRIKLALNIDFNFFMMLGCPDLLCYTLYIAVEPFAQVTVLLEKHLSDLNIEFSAKRQSGRLQQTSVCFVSKTTAEAYKKHCLELGQREGQFKFLKLQNSHDCTFDFEPYKINVHAA
ncbi:MAG: GH3 auxin-responsive promoter family protein [Nitrosomonas sp.]|nr:GH3 auxin-responsive promoter family protein [Nitrosomonas sp.]